MPHEGPTRRLRDSSSRTARGADTRAHPTRWGANRHPNALRRATFIASRRAQSGSVEPLQRTASRGARMFVQFRPRVVVPYEHVFCSARTSTLAQRARETLSLARAFLLLEDDDPVDWEVGQEERAPASHEPTWVPAHRAALHRRLTPRRGGQPAPPPQPCLCPIGSGDIPRGEVYDRCRDTGALRGPRAARVRTATSR